MEDKRVTIYDVAMKCGLSVATVSRVLSNADYAVSEKARARVRETAKAMGYQPNFLGRYLKSNSTNDIGVLIPNISHYQHLAMVEGIHHAMANSGYNTLISFTYYNDEFERQQFLSFLQKRVKGIILVSGNAETEWLKDMPLGDLPVVALETRLPIHTSYVGFDYYEAGAMAADYLWKKGHRRVAVISSSYVRGSRRQRFDGFVETLKKHGVEIPGEYICVADNSRGDGNEDIFALGRRMTEQLLELPERPTALFAINDMLALGAVRTLLHYRLRVPQDMAVVGFGNTSMARLSTPTLTTVDQCAFDMGAAAVEQLLDQFEHPQGERRVEILHPRLFVRETTEPGGGF